MSKKGLLMSIRERKQRENDAFKIRILEVSYGMIQESGLEDFSLRKLAQSLEYSASKLYQFFDSKEAIIHSLCDQMCKELHHTLKEVPQFRDKEKYLHELTQSHFAFFAENPVSSQLIHYVYRNNSGDLPTAYHQAMQFYAESIKSLGYQSLNTENQREEALVTLRLILGGIGPMIHMSPNKNLQLKKYLETSINTLLRGWKPPEIKNGVLK